MIKWKSITYYFDRKDGTEITKRIAKRNYHILKTIKYNNYGKTEKPTNDYRTWFGEATREYWHECERDRQLRIL